MRRSLNAPYRFVHPFLPILLAVAILAIPIRWLFAWLLAGGVHELGHYAAIKLCKKRIYGFRINCGGMILETEDLGRAQWICALGGPLAGLLLVPLYRFFPRIALCALVQSSINLLPIYPKDGGQALQGILGLWLSAVTVRKITIAVSAALLTALFVIVLYLMRIVTADLVGFIFLAVLLGRVVGTITSCKEARLLVQ